MYMPSHFEESRPEVIGALIAAHPLGTLVTLNGGALNANHIPFILEDGVLRAHVARANPLLKELDAGVEALVVFQGEQAYISPSHYPSKKEHGKVVPTWNYMVAHAYGPLQIHDDAEWLRAFVTRLTDRFEGQRAAPWKVSDAPDDYIATMVKAIVGIEIPVTRLLGKWKVGQNRLPGDRVGLAKGMQEEGQDALARALQERS